MKNNNIRKEEEFVKSLEKMIKEDTQEEVITSKPSKRLENLHDEILSLFLSEEEKK